MTDTPTPGAADAARVHGDASALAQLDVHALDAPRRLTAAEADAVFQPRTLGPVDLDTVQIDASPLKPQLLALLRWVIHGLGMWLILHGLSAGQEIALEPIAGGIVLSGGSLAWSVVQKELAANRVHVAAAADPAKVVLR